MLFIDSLINELDNKYNELVNEINQLQDIKNSFGIIHVKPIIMVYNRYEMSNINGWDGNKLETGDGYLLAPQVGAGKKNSDNSFTGIVIGVKQVQEKSATNQKIGLFGYTSGVQSIFLNAEDGSASFGVSGAGQVIIDPSDNKAVIKSGNYNDRISNYIYKRDFDVTGDPSSQGLYEYDAVNNTYRVTIDTSVISGKAYYIRTNALGGMLIDFTTPEIKFGSGNFAVNSDGHITAKGGGEIAGWKITDTQIHSNNTLAQGRLTLDSLIDSTTGAGGKIYTGNHNTLVSIAKGFYLSDEGLSITGVDASNNVKSRIELSTTGNPKIYSGGHDTLLSTVKGFYLSQDGFSICNGTSSKISIDTSGDPEIYSNGHNSTTATGKGFYLGNNGISIHNGFRVTIDSSNNAKLEVGKLSSGRHWTIEGNNAGTHSYIAYNATALGFTYNSSDPTKSSITGNSDSIYLGTDGIRLGTKFAVNSYGQMKASDVQLSGNISATSGSIGGWSINTSGLYKQVTNSSGVSNYSYITPSYIHLIESTAWRQFLVNPGSGRFGIVTNGGGDGGFVITNRQGSTGTIVDPTSTLKTGSWVCISSTGITKSDESYVPWAFNSYASGTRAVGYRDMGAAGEYVCELTFASGLVTNVDWHPV